MIQNMSGLYQIKKTLKVIKTFRVSTLFFKTQVVGIIIIVIN